MPRKKKIKQKGITRNLEPSAWLDVSKNFLFNYFINHFRLIKKLNSEGVNDSQISDILESVESSLTFSFDQLKSKLKKYLERSCKRRLEKRKNIFNIFLQDVLNILDETTSLKPESKEIGENLTRAIPTLSRVRVTRLTEKFNSATEQLKEQLLSLIHI